MCDTFKKPCRCGRPLWCVTNAEDEHLASICLACDRRACASCHKIVAHGGVAFCPTEGCGQPL